MFEFLAVLLLLAVLVGALCGLVAISQISGLRAQLLQLQQQLKQLQGLATTSDKNTITSAAADPAATFKSDSSHIPSTLSDAESVALATTNNLTATTVLSPAEYSILQAPKEARAAAIAAAIANQSSAEHKVTSANAKHNNTARASEQLGWLSWLERQLIDRGMVWLGALALAFGGIFLVKHSLDAGWFSPVLRIASGVLLGLGLLAASEWLHQKKLLGQQLENYIPAALASAGFITLYAALLMAQQMYQLISAPLTFSLLALVAVTASWFSLRQGPILAVIGIIGAYAVPLLVNTGSNDLRALLLYLALITTSSVLVERRVQRYWLWFLPVVAHCGWLLLAIVNMRATDALLLWLAVLASFVALVWLPRLNYRLRWQLTAVPMRLWWPPLREHLLGLGLLCLALLIQLQFASPVHFYACLALLTLLYAAALTDGRSEGWLWIAAAMVLAWAAINTSTVPDATRLFGGVALQWQMLWLLLTVPAIFVVFTLPQRVHWAAFLAIAPLLLLALTYQLVPTAQHILLQKAWMFYAAVLVIIQALLAKRAALATQAFIHSAGANLALSWCFTLYLSAAALTVAFALQLVMLTLLSIKQRFPLPHWFIKALVALVLLRLTTAPLLGSYEGITLLGMHWSLLVYPLVLGCFMGATWLWRGTDLQRWLEGACLQLLAVFITVQSQYWLNDRTLNFGQLDFYSLALHSANWLLLAWVYQWRSYLAGSLRQLYRAGALSLILLAALAQLVLNLYYNPYFSAQPLGSWPLLNWLLLLWAIPALCCFALAKLPQPNSYQPLAYYIAAGFASLYLLSSVRHFWQGGQISLSLATSNAEHYSYSLVLLLLAVLLIVVAELKHWQVLRKSGFVLLSLVVVKVFVFDLNELQGLLRAASFIGLGLSLVLLSAMFQRLQRRSPSATTG
ncbi:DUF2339 domain-containing protein [Alishewanella longhuensis]